MNKILLIIAIAVVFMACGNGRESAPNSDTTSSAASDTTSNVQSTTPPPKKDTNPIGIMMGDTTIGINDSLKKDSLKK
ncbi:MAG: hypothetical protein ICV51_06600 [Flavisolibacter sp.]|nr:hypothetical protein [Flavisolibacter sp.]MBD0285620.1 hypothetical protein [Flavisolibacter sp.]MBD0297991.1 hypothetical protein [Flavisolibacter sp.]MBD0375280.1 hypothetical protein [Flavisolibacter sp.]